jgi:hypothetical protein
MMRGRMTAWVRVIVPHQVLKLIGVEFQYQLYLFNYDGKLLICPMDRNKQIHLVLDVGTGTEIWAIDFGKGKHHKTSLKELANKRHRQ